MIQKLRKIIYLIFFHEIEVINYFQLFIIFFGNGQKNVPLKLNATYIKQFFKML